MINNLNQEQMALFSTADAPWKLDAETKAVGKEGVAKARAAMAATDNTE